MSIRIFDNCLSASGFNTIQQTMSSRDFPWHYRDSKVGPHLGDQGLHDYQFVHSFYDYFIPRSSYMHILDPLVEILNPIALVRIKANLTTVASEIIQYPLHTDIVDNSNGSMTAIYYVNTNNGYTVFESGERVASVANRLVIFDSRIAHSGTTCTDTKTRQVINLNYYSPSKQQF